MDNFPERHSYNLFGTVISQHLRKALVDELEQASLVDKDCRERILHHGAVFFLGILERPLGPLPIRNVDDKSLVSFQFTIRIKARGTGNAHIHDGSIIMQEPGFKILNGAGLFYGLQIQLAVSRIRINVMRSLKTHNLIS